MFKKGSCVDCEIQLWILQSDAYLYHHRSGSEHPVQTQNLVQFLSHGYHDADDL